VLNLVRVPVGVEDDDSVGSLEVEAEAASASAENEEKDIGVWIIEHRQQLTPIVTLCRPIQTQVLVAFTTTATRSRGHIQSVN